MARSTSIEVATKKIVEGMSEDLQEVYKKILGEYQNDAEGATMRRWTIGHYVGQVTENERKYGESAVSQLSQAIGRPEQELWACRRLATAWTKAEMKAMLEKRTARGNTLTYSHFMTLAGIHEKSPKGNAVLYKKMETACYAEDLTVRALLDLIAQKAGKRGNNNRQPRTIEALMHQSERMIATFIEREEVFDKVVFDQIETITASKATPELAESLQKGLDSLSAMEVFAASLRRKLDVALAKVTQMSKGRKTEVEEDDVDLAEEAEAKAEKAKKAAKKSVATPTAVEDDDGSDDVIPKRKRPRAATATPAAISTPQASSDAVERAKAIANKSKKRPVAVA